MNELTYDDLVDMIQMMSSTQRESVVKVKMSAASVDPILLKDVVIAERSLVDDAEQQVFLVL